MFKFISSSLGFLTPRERLTFFLFVVLRALTALLDVFGILLIGVLSGIAASNVFSGTSLVIGGFSLPVLDTGGLMTLVVLVLVVFIGKAILAIWLGRVTTSFIARVETEKSVEISRYLFTSSLGLIQSMSKGEILFALTGSTSAAFSGVLTSFATLISESVLLIFVAVAFVAIDPIASLFVSIYFGLIITLIQFLIGSSLKRAGRNLTEGSMESAVIVNDLTDAYREIVVFNKQEFFIKKFERGRTKLAKSAATVTFLGGMPRYIVETFLMLGVVIFVAWQFTGSQVGMGIAIVGVFITGGVRIMASLLPLQNALANIKSQGEQAVLAYSLLPRAITSVKGLYVRESRPDMTSSHKGAASRGISIDIRNAELTYPGADTATIRNVSLKVSPGQHVAIIGPSGAGKTTLVDLMLGLLEVDSGEVLIDGRPPKILLSQRPGFISYVPQRPGIVTGTIAENIALGISPENVDQLRLQDAIDAAHLRDFVDSLPEGVNTSVGLQADALSGGQIQRLGLARAIYEQPRLIIMDEATSALDAVSEAYITDSISQMGEDITVVVIAHRLSTVQHSDVVYVLDAGEIVAEGKFSELRKSNPMVAEYVKLMSFDEEPQTKP